MPAEPPAPSIATTCPLERSRRAAPDTDGDFATTSISRQRKHLKDQPGRVLQCFVRRLRRAMVLIAENRRGGLLAGADEDSRQHSVRGVLTQ
jgi:hypothetical protein